MIRTSKRKNAGSRRNKKYKFVGSRGSDLDQSIVNAFPSHPWLLKQKPDVNFRNKPNHILRAVPITSAFPDRVTDIQP